MINVSLIYQYMGLFFIIMSLSLALFKNFFYFAGNGYEERNKEEKRLHLFVNLVAFLMFITGLAISLFLNF